MKRLLMLAFVLSLASYGGSPAAPTTPANWSKQMQELKTNLEGLLPELVAAKPRLPLLQKYTANLAKLAHSMEKAGKKLAAPGDADPSLELYAEMFADQTHDALDAIKAKDVEYARRVLQSATATCIACHTRHSGGIEFGSLPDSPAAKRLGVLQRAELHIATRQFDRGADELVAVVSDAKYAKTNSYLWERAVRWGLRVTVQVLSDRDRAGKIVDSVRKNKGAPSYLRQAAEQWQKSLDAWAAEKTPPPDSADGSLAEAKRLENTARSLQQYPADRGGDIAYLRMESALHQFLRKATDNQRTAEAFFSLGNAQEVSNIPEFWGMPLGYFELCVRRAPHTEIAQRCFDRYEASVLLGYSGSGGTRIPTDIERRLKKVRELSAPKS